MILPNKYLYKTLLALLLLGLSNAYVSAQSFPNPADLSTGQGTTGTLDPIWSVSEYWYAASPPNPMTLNYTSALINYNCAPGAWVDASALPPPVNNGNWITGADGNCANNTNSGYRYFRLTLNLPPDCNGVSVTTPGVYTLSFDGYVDNTISDVFVNGVSQGISGGSYAAGSQLSFTVSGPWQVGINYVDILVYNFPNGGGANPYGLLLVANTTSPTDTDGDGVPNIDDLCPCDPGTNPYGCTDPAGYNCDINAIRTAFTNAGCIEMAGCSDECSIYFINPQQMTGSQAQAFAQTLGANLVSIQSQAENDCILSSLTALGQSGVIWIGFSDEISEGNFVWYDQAPITYTNWAPGEPNQSGNEDCVQIYPTGANPGTWNDLSCTSANSKSIIEVNLCPVINAGLDVSVCLGNTANLQASNTLFGSSPYTYAWDNGVNVRPNPVAPTTQTSYIVTTTDRYSCTTKDTVVVNVNPLPVVSAGPDVVVCPQQTVTLNGTGANTYVWTAPVINGTPFLPITASQDYVVTGTDVNGCIDRDTVNVSVGLTGCPNFPNTYLCDPDSIRSVYTNAGLTEMVTCVGECSMYFLNPQSMSGSQAQAFAQTLGSNLVSIQSQAENNCIMSSLNAMGQSGVIWIGFSDELVEGTFVWYDQSPVVYTNWAPGEPNQSGNEDCTQIYANGQWNDLSCNSSNAQSIIEVNLCPVVNAGLDVSVCFGDTANLNAANTILGSAPYIYSWDNGVITQANPVSPSTTTDYILTSTDRFSCIASDTVTVNINTLPPVSAGNDTTICDQEQVIPNASGAISYVWDNGLTNGVAFTPPVGTTTYTVIGTDANGCENSDSMDVTVNPEPIVNAGADFLICQGDTVTLIASGASTYSWDNGVTDGTPFVLNTTNTYTVIGTTAQGCEGTDQITVSVTPTPIVSFSPNVDKGCAPFLVSFTNVNIPGTTCQWDFGNGLTSAACGTVSTVYNDVMCYDVTMVATTANGCVGQTTYNNVVCVAPDPVADFMPNPDVLSQINPAATMMNSSTGATDYIWYFGDGTGSDVASPIHSFPTNNPGSYLITLTAISSIGCTDTASFLIEVEPALTYYIPNTFTPGNTDNINQRFKPIFSSDFTPINYKFTIYDRWGLQLFSTIDAALGWDGTHSQNGKIIEGGMYVWKLEFTNLGSFETKTLLGSVLLLR
jgi:gliding motility-associated-like protein